MADGLVLDFPPVVVAYAVAIYDSSLDFCFEPFPYRNGTGYMLIAHYVG